MATQSGARALVCSLKKCIQDPLDEHMARVEVVTFQANREERTNMEVAWIDGRAAVFHDICWKAVVDSCKMDNPFSLCPLEKDMVAEARKTAEYFDSADRLRREARRLGAMLKTAQYAMAFTGAGISTSAGIGDFRGKNGKWTEMDRAKIRGVGCHSDSPAFTYEALRPTYTHEAICKLVQLGYLKHVISQNTDGLHRLSGIPVEQLSELHGNAFIEKCEKCMTRYERKSAVRRTRRETVAPKICIHCHLDHRTGRKCERKGCDGYLMNIIINFGDSLELHVLRSAEEHARACDLMLCLGSSMRVTPACHLVEMGPEPTRLVLCNRQPTPMDKLCYQVTDTGRTPIGSRVFGDCDLLMKELMKCLLSDEERHEWEAGLPGRLKDYAQQREAPTTE